MKKAICIVALFSMLIGCAQGSVKSKVVTLDSETDLAQFNSSEYFKGAKEFTHHENEDEMSEYLGLSKDKLFMQVGHITRTTGEEYDLVKFMLYDFNENKEYVVKEEGMDTIAFNYVRSNEDGVVFNQLTSTRDLGSVTYYFYDFTTKELTEIYTIDNITQFSQMDNTSTIIDDNLYFNLPIKEESNVLESKLYVLNFKSRELKVSDIAIGTFTTNKDNFIGGRFDNENSMVLISESGAVRIANEEYQLDNNNNPIMPSRDVILQYQSFK